MAAACRRDRLTLHPAATQVTAGVREAAQVTRE